MSIRAAIEEAIDNVLNTYLAPDLVARLSEEIINQAMPNVHDAMVSCVGFEMPKASAKPVKAATRKVKAPKARKSEDMDDSMPVHMPSGEDAREMLPA